MKTKEDYEIEKLRLEIKEKTSRWSKFWKWTGILPSAIALFTLFYAIFSGLLSKQSLINKNESLLIQINNDSLNYKIKKQNQIFDSITGTNARLIKENNSLTKLYNRDSLRNLELTNMLRNKTESERNNILVNQLIKNAKQFSDSIEFYKEIVGRLKETISSNERSASKFVYQRDLNENVWKSINDNLTKEIDRLQKENAIFKKQLTP